MGFGFGVFLEVLVFFSFIFGVFLLVLVRIVFCFETFFSRLCYYGF